MHVTCYMLHVTHVTCHKYEVTKKFTKDPMLSYIFGKLAENSSMIMIKTLHETCVTCHMSHMLHVTNIKLQTIIPKTQCVIYFWKAYAKYSSMIMLKMLHVICVTCPEVNKC